jgi:hypothetical protein
MIRKMILTATMLVASTTAAQAGILLSENFDDVGALAGSGWSLLNNSTPAGETGWFQGNLFAAHSGAADSYIAANFLNAGSGGAVSNWLLSPTLTLINNMTLTFYTRTSDASFADQLQIRLSTSGDSSDLSDFGTLAFTINPALGSDYPADWTQYAVSFSGFTDGILGRIAFNYLIPDTSLYGNYIGIDSVRVETPEPATLVLMLAALVPLGFAARRRRSDLKKLSIGKLTIGLGLVASAGIATAGETATDAHQQDERSGLMSFPNVRVVNAPSATSQPAADKSAGVRVYIDPRTKQIREQTPEEAQAEAQAASAARSTTSARSATAVNAEGTPIYGPGNAVGMILGEETMVYAVAQKQEQGAPAWECVTGNAAAAKVLEQTPVNTSNTAEVRDER